MQAICSKTETYMSTYSALKSHQIQCNAMQHKNDLQTLGLMMKLFSTFIYNFLQVVGLGNPSMRGTRHSIGMTIADRFCTRLELSWTKDRECHGMVAMTTLEEDHTLILLKPRHFMNMNGRSVVKTGRYYKNLRKMIFKLCSVYQCLYIMIVHFNNSPTHLNNLGYFQL